ncbi:MAG: hypothetical protein Q4C81_03020 [Kocuria sp.]|nr:hypothetical protein [Kocuria sp.]
MVTSLAVSMFLVVGVALSGWYVGSGGSGATGGAAPVSGATWVDPQALVHARSSDVDALRADSWTLPLVGLNGYSIESLRHTTVAGQPAITTVVKHDRNGRITVVEQRGHIDPDHPVVGDTDLPASAAGLEPTIISGATVWIHDGASWRAMIVHDDVAYTLVADTAPPAMADLLQQVEAGHRAALDKPVTSDPGTLETIVLGWRRILGLQ